MKEFEKEKFDKDRKYDNRKCGRKKIKIDEDVKEETKKRMKQDDIKAVMFWLYFYGGEIVRKLRGSESDMTSGFRLKVVMEAGYSIQGLDLLNTYKTWNGEDCGRAG